MQKIISTLFLCATLIGLSACVSESAPQADVAPQGDQAQLTYEMARLAENGDEAGFIDAAIDGLRANMIEAYDGQEKDSLYAAPALQAATLKKNPNILSQLKAFYQAARAGNNGVTGIQGLLILVNDMRRSLVAIIKDTLSDKNKDKLVGTVREVTNFDEFEAALDKVKKPIQIVLIKATTAPEIYGVKLTLMPVDTFFKIATGQEELSYLATTSTGNPFSDALMIPVGRFVLIATGEESPSYVAEPTGFAPLDTLMVPVGVFFKIFTGEEELRYLADASLGNPLFDVLMIPVGRFVLVATGAEPVSYAGAPLGIEPFDTLLVPVSLFFKVFSGEEPLSYIATASWGNPLFDLLTIPVGRFVLVATGDTPISGAADPVGLPIVDSLLTPVDMFFSVFSGDYDIQALKPGNNALFDVLMSDQANSVILPAE